MPLAFAEIVETKGQNYDLVENFFTGQAVWESHPERIMNGGWQNYALSNTADKVIFNTNAVGSFVFDKNSCSYSIYGNGYNGEQIIPSVSAVATYYSNGQWQNLPINNEACTVEVDRYEDGVFLTSTKVITEDITEDVFIPYTGTTENFYLNSTNSQFTLVTNSTGNVGYFNGETITLESVEVEKFVQELRLDINSGFKETFKEWHDGDEQLGVSQTVHTGESITIGETVIDIASLNGQSFDRQFIIDNEAEILQLTDSVNYDFDTGIDSLSNVNIIFDSTESIPYKVNMDFAEGNFVGYLEIDPTFTSSSPFDDGRVYGYSGGTNYGNVCPPFNSGDTHTYLQIKPTSYTGHDCAVAYFNFDVSSIPSGSVVSSASMEYGITYVSGTQLNCDVKHLDFTAGVDSTTYDAITFDTGSVTDILQNSSTCASGVGTGYVDTFNTGSYASLFESDISGDQTVSLGMAYTSMARSQVSSVNAQQPVNDSAVLTIVYSNPSPPDAITDLSATYNSPNMDLSWTLPNAGSSSITSFKIYRDTGSGFSLYDTVSSSTLISYQDSNPVIGTTNYYKVNAVTSVSEASDSNTASAVAGTPPDAPTGLTSNIQDTNNAPLDVFLQWSSPVSWGTGTAQGFEVYRNGVLVTTTGLVNSYTDSVTAGTHSHYVKAVSTHGTSANSNTANITTPSVPDAPATVNTSIGNPNANPLDIVVGWSASPNDQGSGITGYNVYRSSDDILYTSIATLGNSVYSYADTVSQSGSYYYKISSVNNVGEGLQSAYSLINTPTVPDAPVLSSNAVNSTQIDSTWTIPFNGNSEILSYEISVDGTVTDLGLVNADSQTGLTQSTAYSIKVRAVNNVGNSAWSNAITSTTNTPPSGTNTLALNNSWGDVVIVDNTITVTGNPTPTLDKIEFVLDSSVVSTVNNPSLTGTYAITLPDTNQHGLLIRATASNGDTASWDSNSITVTGATVNRVDAAEGDNTVAYSIARTPHPTNDALDEIELKWAKDSFPFDGSCTFMSPSQALEVRDLNNLPSNLSFNDQSSVNVYDTTVNISEKNNAYIYCWSGDDLQFAAQSEALGSNALLSGLSGLDSGLGTTVVDPVTGEETSYSILGAPMIVIFVLLIAGQATGRTAPTFIIIILAAIGILMGLGFFIIDEGIFGLILIMGAMGVMIGKKFL